MKGESPFALRKHQRLLRSGEFRRVLRFGRRYRTGFFTLIAIPSVVGRLRLGLTVSRKVGNAVVRNRIKRRLRELFRTGRSGMSRNLDLVVIVHPEGAGLEFSRLKVEFEQGVRRLCQADYESMDRLRQGRANGAWTRKPTRPGGTGGAPAGGGQRSGPASKP